ncbi:toll/interleukin-1 receptor domain-containing protein [Marinobacter gelidimuriae]|uniref:toll/interleukin-1 receptor domain-containing protein n=1 Tax=Marinobacter gelidimuriae TaxID=2739064 RepID=UPI00036385BF|nr:toll/interleukin-1 receptor domain-containing protein [Marinobacter gelidimuriae]
MSIESRQREVARHKKEIAELQKKDADEAKKEVAKAKEAERASKSLSSTKITSSARTYQSKLIRLSDDISKISVKRADIAKKIAQKTDALHRSEQHLSKEQESQRKKIAEADKKREQAKITHQKKITNELRLQRQLSEPAKVILGDREFTKHDVFISHASEDKDSFVRPLAQELTGMGFKVWYDEGTLKVGDSLRQKIDQGLSSSRYGVVVLSGAFFAKNWPQYELNGLVAREMAGGKVILPIWHKVSKDEVLSYSPTLADKVALNTAISSVSEIAQQLSEVLRDNES